MNTPSTRPDFTCHVFLVVVGGVDLAGMPLPFFCNCSLLLVGRPGESIGWKAERWRERAIYSWHFRLKSKIAISAHKFKSSSLVFGLSAMASSCASAASSADQAWVSHTKAAALESRNRRFPARPAPGDKGKFWSSQITSGSGAVGRRYVHTSCRVRPGCGCRLLFDRAAHPSAAR